MQGKKILIIVFLVLSAAIFLLVAIPMRRTYHAEVVVNSDELVTYRTLQDTANWTGWYLDTELSQPQIASLTMSDEKKSRVFDYVLQDQSGYEKKGQVKVSRKNRWSMQVDWSEEFIYKTNIIKKFQLLFNPTDYRAAFLKNMVQFKSAIEHPDSIFGGLTFEPVIIPATKLVTVSDTVSLQDMKDQMRFLYDSLTANLPATTIKFPGTFLSQHEAVNDSSVVLCVAVEVTGETTDVDEPLHLLDLDEHSAVIIQTQKGYNEIDDDIAVMYKWLKKNDKRPATGYWIKHGPVTDIATAPTQHNLTIIQEIYSID